MLKKQQLYQQLKLDIQRHLWPAGSVLTQQQLADYYRVSRIVVRDVQQALMAEGWLLSHGKAGIRVPGFSAAEAEELGMLRLQLEPLALRLAAPTLNFTVLGQAEDVLMQLNAGRHLASYQRGELNWQFHRLLYQGCGKPYLLRILDQLQQQVSRYLGYQEQVLQYDNINADEHLQLLRLLRQADVDAACLLLTDHINNASQLLCAHLKSIRAH
uniref:Transcriptional regulator, GntR family n=1 Tax=Rheinheimera sp. BAL341 TaxID=1708203 RepID=A0A486XJB9_9GAMM